MVVLNRAMGVQWLATWRLARETDGRLNGLFPLRDIPGGQQFIGQGHFIFSADRQTLANVVAGAVQARAIRQAIPDGGDKQKNETHKPQDE
jgi:hypothetical protein